MKAAVFHGAKDIRFEEVAAPRAVGPTEVRLRPLWCGVCGTDVHEYAQGPIVIPTAPHALTGATAPQVLGHEFSAEVLEIGSEVRNVKVGDNVSIMPLLFCGRCYQCQRGRGHLCLTMGCIGLSYDGGGLSEEVVVPAANVFALPEDMDPVLGALVEPSSVAAYGVDRGRVGPGDRVLISGAGPIGDLAALYAASIGAQVTIAEVNPHRLEVARSLDVGEVLDASSVDVAEHLREATQGVGIDVAIECSGNERALQTAMKSVRAAGTVVQTGLHTRPAAIDAMALSERDLSLIGTWCFPVTDWPRMIGVVQHRMKGIEKIVTKLDLGEDIGDRFAGLLDPAGEHVKILLRATR